MASESKVGDISSRTGDTNLNAGSNPTPLVVPSTTPNVSQSIPPAGYTMVPIDVQIARLQAEVVKLQEMKNLYQADITVSTGSGAPAFRKLEFTPNPSNYNLGRMSNTADVSDHDRPVVNDFRPKPPDPKVYKGEVRVLSDPNKEEQTIDEWIEYMDRYMYMTRMDEKFKVTFALMYLKGAPYSYMMMLLNPRGYRDAAPGITVSLPRAEDGRSENEYTWEWMKQRLVANFRPFNQQQLLRDQIKTLKQGDKEDVMTYVQNFNRIASQIQEMTKAEELSYFRAGLKPYHLARIDSAEGAMTLSRAITLAAQQEASYNLQLTRKQNNNNKNSQANNNNKGKQGPHGKNNHANNYFSKKNNNPNNNYYSGYKNFKNYKPPSNNQNDKGQSAPTANVTVQNSANSSLNNIYSNSEYSSEIEEEGEWPETDESDDSNYLANMNSGNNRPSGPWKCHKCNKTGHFIKDCPEMRNNNHQNKRNGQSGKGGAH
jgi:hypothetical protein